MLNYGHHPYDRLVVSSPPPSPGVFKTLLHSSAIYLEFKSDLHHLECFLMSVWKSVFFLESCRNLSELVPTCRNLLELVAICRNLSRLFWLYGPEQRPCRKHGDRMPIENRRSADSFAFLSLQLFSSFFMFNLLVVPFLIMRSFARSFWLRS